VDDADRLAVSLRAKRVGRQYACRCPAHDDRSPSLTFWQGHTAVRVKCWSGCDPLDVLAAFKALGVWPDSEGANQAGLASPSSIPRAG
jgi:putative DNA primase/helicase